MPTLLHIARSCIALTLLVEMLPAQQSTVSVRTLQLGGGDMPECWVQVVDEDAELVQLEWLASQPTQPVRAIHNGKLQLLQLQTLPAGETESTPFKAVALPAGAKEVLLIGMVDQEGAKFVTIEDLFLKARFNDWMALNVSREAVAFQAGDKSRPIKVAPGASIIFQPDIKPQAGVKITAKHVKDGEVKTFFSTYWPAFAGQRTIIIFYRDGERMRARRVGDRFIRKAQDGP